MAAILASAIIIGGLVSYYIYLHQSGRIEPASIEKMAFPLPDKPSIAVLPFDNLSGPDDGYFVDGMVEVEGQMLWAGDGLQFESVPQCEVGARSHAALILFDLA